MINRLQNGDYVPDGAGGFVRLTGQEALLQRALFQLQCRRGAFPMAPELGSRLYLLGRESASARPMLARQYCVQALAAEPVRVLEVTVTQQEEKLLVAVQLAYDAQQLTLEVTA